MTIAADLFTTDISGLSLFDQTDDLILNSIIIPQNRIGSEKIQVIQDVAQRRNIPLVIHESTSSLDKKLPHAELALSWLYSQIIKPGDLEGYRLGALNMHGGKIPEYRGSNVLQWAVINGERQLGVTWHEMVEEVDAGVIWAESAVEIEDGCTTSTLRTALIAEGISLFGKAFENFKSNQNGRVPDLGEGRVWPRRTPSDSEISPNMSSKQLHRFITILSQPLPPAFVYINGHKVEIAGLSNESVPSAIAYETSDVGEVYLIPKPGEQNS